MTTDDEIEKILERLEVRTYKATRANPDKKLGQISGLLGERDKDQAAINRLLVEAQIDRLQYILNNASGGNWRRIIISQMTKLIAELEEK